MIYPLFSVLLFLCALNFASAIKSFNFHIVFNDTGINFPEDVRFFLYTRLQGENPQQLWVDDKISLQASAYNASQPTKFITHGWLNTYQGLNCKTIRRAFLARDDYNAIVVDWGNVAKLPYLESAARTKAVGAYVARMISFLESQGSDPNDMSLVGHSLGAHVMGLAGYQATNKVAHVVGLDPAAPGFMTAGPGRGISSSDADLVEIVHTNAGYMGLSRPAGHADFYPNGGGLRQPGCGEDANNYCAHDRAYVYFAEAITRPEGLIGVRCKDYEAFLRGDCEANATAAFPRWSADDKNKRGIYYLRTAETAPFGLGVDGTRPPEAK